MNRVINSGLKGYAQLLILPLITLITEMVSGFFLVAIALSPLAEPNCEANTAYISVCSRVAPTERCSTQLSELCCRCQDSWAISLAMCSFAPFVSPTPSPSPSVSPSQSPNPSNSPTPQPTTEPTPFVPDSACLNGIDTNNDGLIDINLTPCIYQPGCELKPVGVSKETISAGALALEKLAKKALSRLKAAPKITSNKGLAERLTKSAKGAKKKIPKWVKEANLELEVIKALPDKNIVCVNVASPCGESDVSTEILKYQNGVRKLGNGARRILNRSSRLIYDTLKVAQVKTKKLGTKIRNTTKKLVADAEGLPKKVSACEGR